MSERSTHTSTLPELHRLYHSPTPSHILGTSNIARNLLRYPVMLIHKNLYQTSLSLSSSSDITPKKPVLPIQRNNSRAYGILQGSSQAVAMLAVAPIERVFLLMQCQNELLKYGYLSSPYKGMKDCLFRTIKNEGVLSLWRGSSISVIRSLTFQASVYAMVHSKRDSTSSKKVDRHRLPLWLLPLGGMVGSFLLYPLDYARTRLANDVKTARKFHFSLDSSGRNHSSAVGDWKFNGVFDVFKKTFQSEGIVGFYRGCASSCVAILAYQTTWVIGSQSSEIQTKEKQKTNSASRIMTVPIILITLSVVCYPLVTISHRMMMTSGERTKYKDGMDAVRQIVRYEGVSSLYKGLPAFVIHRAAKDAVVFAYLYLLFSGVKQLKSSS